MTKKFKFASIAVAVVSAAALGVAACEEMPDGIEDLIPGGTSVQTVTFDANGGSYADSVTVPVTLETGADGKLTAFPTTNPTHESSETHNYSFGGWTLVKDTAPLLDLAYVYTEATTVYAFWNMTPKTPGGQGDEGNQDTTYTVTFHANGGAWGEETQKTLTTNIYGSLAELPEAPTHPEGLTFKGYTIGQTDSGAYINVATLFTNDEDVYAQWGSGESGNPGDEDDPIGDMSFYLYGTVSDEGKYSPETGYKFEVYPSDDSDVLVQYAVTVTLSKGDHVKIFRADDSSVEWNYNNYEGSWPYGAYDGNNFQIKVDGDFTFYLKIKQGGSSVWVAFDGELNPMPKSAAYKVGESGELVELTKAPITDDDMRDGITGQYVITEAQFETDDKIYIVLDGAEANLSIQTSSSCVAKPAGNNNKYIEIAVGGTFTIRIKRYDENSYWTIYASRKIEESEITKRAEEVTAGNGYLLGNIFGSDTSWDTTNKGFKLEKQADSGLYELVIQLTKGDDVKFHRLGSATVSEVWLNNIVSFDMTDYIAVSGDNIGIKETGYFHFLVDFDKSRIYVAYGADADPGKPEIPVIQGPEVVGIGNSGVWLVGDGIGGGWGNGVELIREGSTTKYSVTITVIAGAWVKIRNGGSSDGSGTCSLANTTYAYERNNDFYVNSTGLYKITFDTSTGKITVDMP
ncbi:MAG: InlB B-repeat-containing protein [Clostridiales bacterium]|nr:InlB B-repeat-containing protein [Clostridiales bacterium]